MKPRALARELDRGPLEGLQLRPRLRARGGQLRLRLRAHLLDLPQLLHLQGLRRERC